MNRGRRSFPELICSFLGSVEVSAECCWLAGKLVRVSLFDCAGMTGVKKTKKKNGQPASTLASQCGCISFPMIKQDEGPIAPPSVHFTKQHVTVCLFVICHYKWRSQKCHIHLCKLSNQSSWNFCTKWLTFYFVDVSFVFCPGTSKSSGQRRQAGFLHQRRLSQWHYPRCSR